MSAYEGIVGAAVVLLTAVLSFLAGLLSGALSQRKADGEREEKRQRWIRENCCYLCQEKFRDPLQDLDEEEWMR